MAKSVCLNPNSDRISALPEPLKHQILSYLSTQELVRTSLLSSNWREVWMTVLTRLELDGSRIVKSLLDNNKAVSGRRLSKPDWNAIDKAVQDFCELNHRVLGSLTNLDELKLSVPYKGSDSEIPKSTLEMELHLQKWFNCVVDFNVVKKLDLDLGESSSLSWDRRYWLPPSVLTCKSLTNLRLSRCKVDLSTSLMNEDQLPSLKELWLKDVDFYGTDFMFERLLSKCTNLESFTCIDCHGLSRLKLLGLPKLERVEVVFAKRHYTRKRLVQECRYTNHSLGGIEIDAPNLLELSFECKSYGYESCQIELSHCNKLKSLKLCNVRFEDDNLSAFLKDFPFHETMTIGMCNRLRSVAISNQRTSKVFDIVTSY